VEGEVHGLRVARATGPSGAVVLLRDYPLPDGEALARRLLAEGTGALRDLPDNTLALGVRGGEAWAARDKIGNTPLYAMTDGEDLLCASSLAELAPLRGPGASTLDIDPARVGEYVLFRYVSGPDALVAGVKMPLGGHLLHVDAAGTTEHRCYFDVRSTFAPRAADLDDTARQVRDVMGAALRREEELGPLGIMFSAGLDSGYLAYACERRRDLRLYTIAFPGVGRADLDAASVEARSLGVELVPLETSGATFAANLPTAIAHFGWPVDHPNFVARDLLFGRAVEDGIDRLLSGDGADTIFGGAWYVSLAKSALAKALLPRAARWLPAIHPRLKQLAKVAGTSIDDLILYDKTYYDQDAAFRLVLERDRAAPVAHLRAALARVADWEPLDRAFFLAYLTTLSVYPSMQRGLAWARGADVGYPFLGEVIVACANAVPAREKVRGFVAKRLLKRAVAGRVPPRLVQRKKYGLPVPFEDFVFGDGGLLRFADLLVDPRAATDGVLDRREVGGLVKRLRDGRRGSDDVELFWMLLNLELWARIVLRGESIA
jgi:asparagine synthase (glutamine-hydrolysing)